MRIAGEQTLSHRLFAICIAKIPNPGFIMATLKRFFFAGALLLLAAPLTLHAQSVKQLVSGEKPVPYQAERQFIESTLQTIVTVIQEATVEHESSGLGSRLRDITSSLARAAQLMDPTPSGTMATTQTDDLDELRRLLQSIAEQLEVVQEALEDEESYTLADQVRDIERDLRRAIREVDRVAEASEDQNQEHDHDAAAADDEHEARKEDEAWLRPGRYNDQRAEDDRARREDRQTKLEREMEDIQDDIDAEMEAVREEIQDAIDEATDGRYDARERRAKRRDWERKRRSNDWWRYTGAFVGDYSFRWPYRRETALYDTAPAIRYNRVEGPVIGIGRQPLNWNSYGRATVYGQVGYAFKLDEWRTTIGVETRVDNRRNTDYGLKVGAAFRYNTDSRDTWKTSWLENSLAAFFFENDFFDYYEVEGWTFYAVQRISPYIQFSAGYRDEIYRTLDKNTGWSLFKGDGFAENPAIDDGDLNSLIFALEGGRVRGLHSLPRGIAFRAEVEISDGIGGDFAFNRYIGDARAYIPVTEFSSLGLRLRGGVTTGDFIPLQKQFTIGGIGSVRGYIQNSFLGSRMLLGNVEYIVDGIDLFDDLFDDIQFIGFADFGWVNAFGTNEFDVDAVLPTAGFGIGLDDRDVRLELTFPLRDFGTGHDPSLWLRITPSF